MWLMLKQKKPEDFVISTGKQYSVKYFATLVLNELNIKHKWVGSGIKEKCINDKNESIIEINKKYFRPLEVDTLLGDSRKAKKKLKWKPKFNIKQLVNEMVQSELQIHE
jgi:GDPmannose 4,6-dehydratase